MLLIVVFTHKMNIFFVCLLQKTPVIEVAALLKTQLIVIAAIERNFTSC